MRSLTTRIRSEKCVESDFVVVPTCAYTNLDSAVWGSIVVKALHYKSDGPGIESRCCHWGFFPWLATVPCALMSIQPLKVSNRDFCWSKGGRCLWLTTYHPCSAEHQENPGP